MKIKQYLVAGSLAIILTGVIFAGCKKNNTTTTATDTTAAQDDANASFAIQDTKNVADGAAKGQASERLMSGCESIRRILPDTTINSVADSAIDIFFGNADCNCLDNRTRRGHIIVYWPVGQHYIDSGASVGMTFVNYYLNDIGITGNRSLQNTGRNMVGSQSWKLSATLTLAYPNGGGTASWTCNHTCALTLSNSVYYFSVTGSSNGTSRKGSTFTINITSPLYFQVPYWLIRTNPNSVCTDIEAGQITANVSSFSYPIYVTFGTALGTCSNSATATINGVTFSFSQQ